MPDGVSTKSRAALERLIVIAQGDTGRVASLPTSCWPGGTHKSAAASISQMYGSGRRDRRGMVRVFALMPDRSATDSLGYSQHFDEIMRVWRPARR